MLQIAVTVFCQKNNQTMCLILFAINQHPEFPFVLAANRDEFFQREALPLHFWHDYPQLLAGKDLAAGGTWLGITESGKFSALTNYRDFTHFKTKAPSRGSLALDFLRGTDSPSVYLEKLKKNASNYNGFNLLAGSFRKVFYYSNIEGKVNEVSDGVHGLSNALLDSSWPKTEKGKAELHSLLTNSVPTVGSLFEIMQDQELFADESLPNTGIGLEKERLLSPKFIRFDNYGTRCTTVILVNKKGECLLAEKTYSQDLHTSEEQYFRLKGTW